LLVSQFTLLAQVSKHKPDFRRAKTSIESKVMYDSLVRKMAAIVNVQEGVFGAMMNVESVNDGPVTILLDTKVEA
jgi:D-tyrosyl-tRNA(Tyr) deacylase